MQTIWTSKRVVAGTAAYDAAKRTAAAIKADNPRVRIEWVDEYNDYSVAGVFRARA